VSFSSDDNGIQVVILGAGVLSGGPFTFFVDGVPDILGRISSDNPNGSGTNRNYGITDDSGNILELPPALEAVEGVDFDGAGAGVCLIWYLRYEDGLQGLEKGMNARNLDGCFDVFNSLKVTGN
jgi:hypothetical protein